MFRRITKLSVAATLLIAAGLTVYFLGDGPQGSNVAWASLVERLDAVDTCSYRMRAEVRMEGLPGPTQTESLVYASTPLGMRMDNYVNGVFSSTMYYLVEGRQFINVIPALKRVQRSTLPASAQEQEGEQDPKIFVRAFLAGEHEKLGESEIDGVAVEGIRALKPQFIGYMFTECTGTLWVEQAGGWPYLLEIEGTANQGKTQMKMTFDQFQWDIPLKASLFDPNIPADYTITEIATPEYTEETLIEGLRCFSANAGGHYPSSMDMQTVMTEFMRGPSAEKPDFLKMMKSLTDEEGMRSIGCASAFYGLLENQDQDPAYYGDQVESTDVDAVLVRWKLDEGSYRVVYGDLRIETVSEERLKEVEGDHADTEQVGSSDI